MTDQGKAMGNELTTTLRIPYLKHPNGDSAEIVLEDVPHSALLACGFVPKAELEGLRARANGYFVALGKWAQRTNAGSVCMPQPMHDGSLRMYAGVTGETPQIAQGNDVIEVARVLCERLKLTPEPGEPVGGKTGPAENRILPDANPTLRYCNKHPWAAQATEADPEPRCPSCGGFSRGERLHEVEHLQSALTRAEGRVREVEAELDQVCDVLYHTGATRGDALTRAKRAKNTYKELINESADRDEAIEGALRELDSVVSTARERAPSIVYGAINVARSRLRAQPPLASSVVADEATTGGRWVPRAGQRVVVIHEDATRYDEACTVVSVEPQQTWAVLVEFSDGHRDRYHAWALGPEPGQEQPSPLTGEEGKAERVGQLLRECRGHLTRALGNAQKHVNQFGEKSPYKVLRELHMAVESLADALESRAAKGGSDDR